MNKFVKNLSVIAPTIVLSSVVSCTNYSQKTSLDKYIDKSKDIVPPVENSQEVNTKKILDVLIKANFRSESAKVNYFNQMKDPEHIKQIEEGLKQFSNEWTKAKKNQNNDKLDELVKSMEAFYSLNWYYVLSNLDKFKLDFYKWFTFPKGKNGDHSDKYKETISNLSMPDLSKVQFGNDYLSEIKEGEESAELLDKDIFYLLKDKNVFRISINDAVSEHPKILLKPYVWSFANSKASKISLNLISNVVHSAFIHGDQEGFDRLENDLVVKFRYGIPAVAIMLYKGVE
ncbi:aromatic motif membrane protein [Mycoplasmopsis felifaucium]|uniref:aromatic motif membrane protein n=1 Tax=Mycoplasmopsis felifaucium TaxID=35768 RepID=UPI000489C128|nr:aromatic motif membrane protein [Mycoplasmopsis felifaucium]